MEKKYIIIPSAVLMPNELQYLGKLPAVIYPVNQRIMFDYLYAQYKDVASSIRVICGQGREKIHDRLGSYAAQGKLSLIDLPEVKDLGYTVQQGIFGITEPVIINFGDTVVDDQTFPQYENGGYYYYSEDIPSDKWTFFEEEGGKLTVIYDKTMPCVKANQKCKLFVGVFSIRYTEYFYKCLQKAVIANDRRISTFYCALRDYSMRYPLTAIKTEQWFDIGHADNYRHFGLEVKAREFNHISIDRCRGILRKTSDDKEKFIGEIKWYLKLPTDVEYVSPRIFDYSTSYDAPYVSMEYYAYHTLHELYLYGALNERQWVDIFERVRFVCNDFRRYSVVDAGLQAALADMYLTKTLQRLEKLRGENQFSSFFYQPVTVNGKTYVCMDSICRGLTQWIPRNLYDVKEFTLIHGDLCFTNIMVDNDFSFIKLIDPRGKFGAYDIYGDPRYEIAKLLQCVDGKYDYIIKELFDIEFDISKSIIHYTIKDDKRDYDIRSLFLSAFCDEIGSDLKKIELIEALLFFSMIPLHNESYEQQLVMLATGLDILNRVICIEEGEKRDDAK